jgi:hypothetical protein
MNKEHSPAEALTGAITALDGVWSPEWINALRRAGFQMAAQEVDALLMDYLTEFVQGAPEVRIVREIAEARKYALPRTNLDAQLDIWCLRWFQGEERDETMQDALIDDVRRNGSVELREDLEAALLRMEHARAALLA